MIEKYVVSLDLAKKLKEAGYPQDGGGWYWIKEEPGAEWELKYFDKICECPHICPSVDPDEYKGDCEFNGECTKWVSKDFWKCEYLHLAKAPLAEEILKKLPKKIVDDKTYRLRIEKYDDHYTVGYCYDYLFSYRQGKNAVVESVLRWLKLITDSNISNALARLWLWLKENGYLEEKNED